MAKESYTHEIKELDFKESYDIKVTDEGVEYITITDSEGRMSFPSWHLIEELHKSINKQLKYFEEMQRKLEQQEEDEQ